jgi:hypothetical protein
LEAKVKSDTPTPVLVCFETTIFKPVPDADPSATWAVSDSAGQADFTLKGYYPDGGDCDIWSWLYKKSDMIPLVDGYSLITAPGKMEIFLNNVVQYTLTLKWTDNMKSQWFEGGEVIPRNLVDSVNRVVRSMNLGITQIK